MRFTRPGARPCHHPSGTLSKGSESTQLRGRVLSSGIKNEGARTQLRTGQVLELVAAAIGWIELDVEVMVAAGATGQLLMHRHHIGQRERKEAVIFLEQAFQD